MFISPLFLLLAVVLNTFVLIHGASTPLEKDEGRIRSVALSTAMETLEVSIGTGGREVGHDAAYDGAGVMGTETDLGGRVKRQYGGYNGYNRNYGGYPGYRSYGNYGGYPGYRSYRNYGGYRSYNRNYGGYRGNYGGSDDSSTAYGGASVHGGTNGSGGHGQQTR